MARSVIMPKTGMAMEEGTIVRWLKKPGDTVTRGEPIAVIETDKVTMDLEAEDEGTLLAIVHGDGAVVKVTDTIAWIGAPGETVEAAAPVCHARAAPRRRPGARRSLLPHSRLHRHPRLRRAGRRPRPQRVASLRKLASPSPR